MRARLIRPGFWDDFEVGRLHKTARLLFIGLWCLADREGRLLDIPRRIAAELFPHDEPEVESEVAKWLTDLAEIGVIVRYEVSSGKYIEIKNFKKHQHIH